MSTLTLPAVGKRSDETVQIAVMVVSGQRADAVTVDGPVGSAVRSAFADSRLAEPLEALHMDPERLISRIRARWEQPEHAHETRQLWEKSNGSTIVRWCVDRKRSQPPRLAAR